jgi:hypothetical protein
MRAQTNNHKETPGQQAPPEPPGGTGRDAAGRFTAGNKYGPGNPFARQTAELRKVLLEVVTPEEMRQVAFTLVLLAKTGKLEAIKLLLQYVIGKPGAAVDPDRLDVDEWKLAQESKVNVADLHQTVQHMPAETANLLVRHAWPASAETNYLAVARDELEAMDREDAERARAREEARAEANGGDGAASAPHPRPLSHEGRGEKEKGGEVEARGGRPAKPQAVAPRAAEAPSANGGNGAKGRQRRSSGAEPNGGNGPMTAPQRASPNGGNGAGRTGPPRR